MAREDKIHPHEPTTPPLTPGPSVKVPSWISLVTLAILLLLLFFFFILPRLAGPTQLSAAFLVNDQENRDGGIQLETQTLILKAFESNYYQLNWAIASEDQTFDTLIYKSAVVQLQLPKAGEYYVQLMVENEEGESWSHSQTLNLAFSQAYIENIGREMQEMIQEYLQSTDPILLDKINAKCISPAISLTFTDSQGRLSNPSLEDFLKRNRRKQVDFDEFFVEVDDYGKVIRATVVEHSESQPIAQINPDKKQVALPMPPVKEDAGAQNKGNEKNAESLNNPRPTSPARQTPPVAQDDPPPSEKTTKRPIITELALESNINDLNNNDPSLNWTATKQKIQELMEENFAEDCVFIRVSLGGSERPLHKSFKSVLEEVALLYGEDEKIKVIRIEYNTEGKIKKLVFKDPI